jgi:hypothetical protein
MNKKNLMKVISASLLGDGYINKEGNKNGRFRLTQNADHRDHVEYLANYLEQLTRVVIDVDADKETLRLRTMAHPTYSKIHERMYLNGLKVVDPHYLTLLDAEFMAIWYMQDGYLGLGRTDVVNPDIVLCTDNFSYGDQLLLRHAIIERTGFIFNVRRKGINKRGELTYRMYLYRKQAPKFIDYIQPYIQPSFYYKIDIARQDAYLHAHKI